MLKDVEKILNEMGFRCYIKENELIVPLRIDEYLMEFFADEEGNAIGVIYDAEKFVREDLLVEILKIPTKFKVSIGMDEEGDLIFDAWHVKLKKTPESILGAFILFTSFVKWLRRQLDKERAEPFNLEEEKI